LESIGLEGQRIKMVNLSAAMGGQFAIEASEMAEQVTALGPNPLRNHEESEEA
jgi:F420-non-reducing hydrogenase iron-sulfur subunit